MTLSPDTGSNPVWAFECHKGKANPHVDTGHLWHAERKSSFGAHLGISSNLTAFRRARVLDLLTAEQDGSRYGPQARCPPMDTRPDCGCRAARRLA
jgi:hypothetical protein